jgi:hypothetical protein
MLQLVEKIVETWTASCCGSGKKFIPVIFRPPRLFCKILLLMGFLRKWEVTVQFSLSGRDNPRNGLLHRFAAVVLRKSICIGGSEQPLLVTI